MGNEQTKQSKNNTYQRQSSDSSLAGYQSRSNTTLPEYKSSNQIVPKPQPEYTNEFIPDKNPTPPKQLYNVGDKVSYHFNGVRSLATVEKVTRPDDSILSIIYIIRIDGTECVKEILHTDSNLEKADFNRVERNWGRMNRDADRRLEQKKLGFKCTCDPNYECICHLKAADMRPRIEIPKPIHNPTKLQTEMIAFIDKHANSQTAQTFKYIGFYLTNREYCEGDVVVHKINNISSIYYAIKNIEKEHSPLAGLPWIKVDSFTQGHDGFDTITICGIKFINSQFRKTSDPIVIDLSVSESSDLVVSSPKDETELSPINLMVSGDKFVTAEDIANYGNPPIYPKGHPKYITPDELQQYINDDDTAENSYSKMKAAQYGMSNNYKAEQKNNQQELMMEGAVCTDGPAHLIGKKIDFYISPPGDLSIPPEERARWNQ